MNIEEYQLNISKEKKFTSHTKRRPTEQRGFRRRPRVQQKLGQLVLWIFLARGLDYVPIPGLGSTNPIAISSLGIGPYINASIFISILTPTLFKEIREKGDYGSKKLTQYTRYASAGLALLYSIVTSETTLKPLTIGWNIEKSIVAVLALTAGAVFLQICAERITDQNLGSGYTVLGALSLCDGVVGRCREFARVIYEKSSEDPATTIAAIATLSLGFFLVYGAIALGEAYTSVPLRSIKATSRRESQAATLPISILSSGVGPLIGSRNSLGLLYSVLPSFAGDQGTPYGSLFELICNSTLIPLFSYASALQAFSPKSVSKTLQNSDWVVFDNSTTTVIRPGDPTRKYLTSMVTKTSFAGALLLLLLSLTPEVLRTLLGPDIGPSSRGVLDITVIFILVGATTEIIGAVDAYTLDRLYAFSDDS